MHYVVAGVGMLRLSVRDELDREGPCKRSAERLGSRAIATTGALVRSARFEPTDGSLESRFGFVFDAHGQGPRAGQASAQCTLRWRAYVCPTRSGGILL